MASPTASQSSWAAEIRPFLIYLVVITTLGPLQFGFHLAELNAPEHALRCITSTPSRGLSPISQAGSPTLPSCIPMTTSQFGLVTSIYTLGGLLGALSSGPLSTRSGRLLPMRITSIFFILGALLSSLSPSFFVMAVGRFMSGVGAGAALVVVPIYISEISPRAAKGAFGALTQVMINVGILIAQLLGYFLSYGAMWRVVLGVAAVIGLVQAFGLIAVVESPEWLAAKGRVGHAKKELAKMRAGDIEEEAKKWGNAVEGEEEQQSLLSGTESAQTANQSSKKPSQTPIGILEVVVHPDHYKAIIAVVGVMLAQQLCGINSVIAYSVNFLSDILPTTAGLITVAVGALNLIVTIACAPLADKLGRKPCLLYSISGMGTNALVLGIAITFNIQWLSALATLLFVASFALGLGPVPFILASELVGPEAVGATQSWALAANWTATFLVLQFFPILNLALGKGRVFFVFALLALGFAAFVAWWVPETKGRRDADEVWGRVRRVD